MKKFLKHWDPEELQLFRGRGGAAGWDNETLRCSTVGSLGCVQWKLLQRASAEHADRRLLLAQGQRGPPALGQSGEVMQDTPLGLERRPIRASLSPLLDAGVWGREELSWSLIRKQDLHSEQNLPSITARSEMYIYTRNIFPITLFSYVFCFF